MKNLNFLIATVVLALGLTSCNFDEPWLGGGGASLQANFITVVDVESDQAQVTLINTSIGANSYEWSFPGGNPGSSQETTPDPVVYTQNGTYEITLVASNGNDTDEVTKTVTIEGIEEGGNTNELSASFSYNVTVQQGVATVAVDNQSTGATSYNWSFPGGNPSSSQEENPSDITYTEDGSYTITLEVSNGTDTETATQSFTVTGLGGSNGNGSGTDCVEGSGAVGTTTINGLGYFEGVKSKSSFEVNITQGNSNNVTVSGYENLFDHLDFSVVDNVLELQFATGCYENVNLVVDVTIANLTSIENAGSGDINIEDNFTLPRLGLKITGSGSINGNEDINVTQQLQSDVLGSGSISVQGTATTQSIKLAGSGDYYGFELITTNATVTNYGAGDAEVYVSGQLNTVINGVGNIYYKGSPSIDSSGFGPGQVINAN